MASRAPSVANGAMILADISGYTSFLRSVADAHQADAFADGAVPQAYTLLSSLLDGIVQRLVPPFTLSKLEGDAVFAFAEDAGQLPRESSLLECIAQCHEDFRRTVAMARSMYTCDCGICSGIVGLDLKFVLHSGQFVMQSIAGGRELSGPEVVIAHRLLKTGARELVGHGAYAVVTDAAARRFAIPIDDSLPLVESIEHYPPVHLHVFPLAEG